MFLLSIRKSVYFLFTIVTLFALQRAFAGGAGMDGGGGATVLSSNGQLRFLDLAVDEKINLTPFDEKSYSKILLKFGSVVSPVGTMVSSKDFFLCKTRIELSNNLALGSLGSVFRSLCSTTSLPLFKKIEIFKIPFLNTEVIRI